MNIRRVYIYILLPLVLSIVGCGFRKSFTIEDIKDRTEVCYLHARHIQQNDSIGCGLSALAMVLDYWGKETEVKKIESAHREGSDVTIKAKELKKIAESAGCHAFVFKGHLKLLKKHLELGRPLIVALSSKKESVSHFTLLIGYFRRKKIFIFDDPKFGKCCIATDDFVNLWSKAENFVLLVTAKEENK